MPSRVSGRSPLRAARRSARSDDPSGAVPAGPGRHDVAIALTVMAWIGAVLVLDGVQAPGAAEPARQLVLGLATWAVLAFLLRRETPLVRMQTMVVVLLATCVEYTFSPLLEAYVYRIGTVPLFVPPGHGLVYLAAFALGRSAIVRRHARAWIAATVAVGGVWATYGVVWSPRPDALGAFWFCCLLGFLAWGPSRTVYVGAFVVVSYLELTGTALGTWAWAESDPVLHVIGQGNPPSGAAGGYGWFDLYALLAAPRLLAGARAVRARVRRSGIPRAGLSGGRVGLRRGVVCPGGGPVVGGTGLEAAVEDADEAVVERA